MAITNVSTPLSGRADSTRDAAPIEQPRPTQVREQDAPRSHTPPSIEDPDRWPVLPPPQLELDNIATLLLEVQTVLTDAQSKTGKESVQHNRTKQQGFHDDAMKKLDEAAKAMEKKANSAKVANIFGWIGMAFAAVVAVVAVVAAIATGGALLAPVIGLLVTAAFIVLQATGKMDVISEKLAEGIANAMKATGWFSKETCEGFGRIMATLLIAAIMVGVSFGTGSGAAISKAIAESGAVIAKIAFVALTAAKIAEGASMVAKGTATTVSAFHGSDEAHAMADKFDIDKFLIALKDKLQQEMDRILDLQQQLNETTSHIVDMLKGFNRTGDEVAMNLGGRTA